MENWGYIAAAYVLTGLSIGGYVWYLRQTERRLRRLLEEASHARQ